MSGENLSSLNYFMLTIKLFIMISVWNEILSEGTHGAKNHRIVYEGETVILDCYLTAVGVILHYSVFWVKEGKKIDIDKNLSWNQHLSSISSQIARGIGILYRIKNLLPRRTLLSLYNTLILPYINYCNIAWGNCSKTKLDNVLLLQKKAIKHLENTWDQRSSNGFIHV